MRRVVVVQVVMRMESGKEREGLPRSPIACTFFSHTGCWAARLGLKRSTLQFRLRKQGSPAPACDAARPARPGPPLGVPTCGHDANSLAARSWHPGGDARRASTTLLPTRVTAPVLPALP